MNKILFPAPSRSYDETTYKEMFWLPHDYVFDNNSKKPHIPCLFIPYENSNNVCIYLHGNGCDVGEMYDDLKKYSKAFKMNVCGVEYRGYGMYPGETSATEIKRDAKRVFKFFNSQLEYPTENIVIFGRSVGTGPATYLAANVKSHTNKDVGTLILQSPYKSVVEMAKEFVGFVGSVVPNKFNSISLIPHVTCPTLFIHGKLDNLIPYSHSEALFAASGAKDKYLQECKQADHNWWDVKNDILIPGAEFLAKYHKPKQDAKVKPIPAEAYTAPTFTDKQFQSKGFFASLFSMSAAPFVASHNAVWGDGVSVVDPPKDKSGNQDAEKK